MKQDWSLTTEEALMYYVQGVPLLLKDTYRSCYKEGGVITGNWEEDVTFSEVSYRQDVNTSKETLQILFCIPESNGYTMEDDFCVSSHIGSDYFVDKEHLLLN